jgi:O-antigen biosynthesis protein
VSKAPPVLVLGMHRGGTSAVSQILVALGLDAGPSAGLIGATDSNRHGHYEVRKITDLNEEMLASLGCSWLSPPTDAAAVAALAKGPFREQAREALSGQFTDQPWFLKDPRLSLLLPFWREVLPIQPVVIGVVRSPSAIVRSLLRRDGLPVGYGEQLTNLYFQSMINDSEGLKSLVLCYEELLDSPKASVEVLTKFLTKENIGEFVYTERSGAIMDRSDNHHTSGSSLEAEMVRGWHGQQMPESFAANELPEDLLGMATVLAKKIHLVDHFRGVAAEREELLAGEQNKNTEISGELADRKVDLSAVLVERERAIAEVEAIRAFRAAEVVSTTYQLVALVTRVGAKWAPQGSRRRLVISALLRRLRKSYSYLRSLGVPRRRRRNLFAGQGIDLAPLPVSIDLQDSPTVSIVIPVYGQVAVTARCLKSIAVAKNETTFEVVVVDDKSPDATSEYLAKCSGIQVVTNDENQGYLRSTNRGAKVSDTEYIILLNNDTEVADGWIDDLLSTFQHHPDTGIAGARLVYPGGQLQEAGAIIFNDGTGWNYGRLQDPDDEKFAFVREVDYCSAACVAVKRQVWDEVGGFDERFIPAYYEDVDLAFAARSKGWKVRYQPKTKIIHHEGVSHGTDEASGLKAYQKINHAVFVGKWAKDLREQMPSGEKNVTAAANRGSSGHIFVADYEVPHWDRHAGGLRMRRLLGILAEMGWRITFAPGNQAGLEPYATDLRQSGIEIFYHGGFPDKAVQRLLQSVDVALLSRPEDGARWLSAFRSASPATHIIYDTVDLHTLRNERGRLLGRVDQSESLEEQIAEQEQRLIEAADQTFVVSGFEKDWLAKRLPKARVSVVGLVHDEPMSETNFNDRTGLLFVGSWNHKPNQDAVRFLLSEIMPLLWEEIPEMKLHLVGSDMPQGLGGSDTRVTCHGWVEDLTALFDKVRLSLAPLRFGAGLKGKVAESLCRGIPVVGTSVAFEGFEVNEILRLGEAEGPREIVQAISTLYQNEKTWKESSLSGRIMVEKLLGQERVSQDLKLALQAADVLRN